MINHVTLEIHGIRSDDQLRWNLLDRRNEMSTITKKNGCVQDMVKVNISEEQKKLMSEEEEEEEEENNNSALLLAWLACSFILSADSVYVVQILSNNE